MTQKDKEKSIRFNKELRARIDGEINALDEQLKVHATAERTLAKRALQTARHWLGEDLHILGSTHPYPNGNNPENIIVDPKADVAPVPATVILVPAAPEPAPADVVPSQDVPGFAPSEPEVVNDTPAPSGHTIIKGEASVAGNGQ